MQLQASSLRSAIAALALIATAAQTSSAHDFWVMPSDFAPQVDSVLDATLFIGHASEREPYARNPKHLLEFTLVKGDQRVDVLGRPGISPAGHVRIEAPGDYALVYRSNANLLELEPQKFEAYLAEEGLDFAIAERQRLGEAQLPGREAYSRAAKALLRTAATHGPWLDRPLGLPLELVVQGDLEQELCVAQEGQPPRALKFQVLRDGQPLREVRVALDALERVDPNAAWGTNAGVTDENGMVELPVLWPGSWVASCVHMQRAESEQYEWQSVWASLVLPIGAAKTRVATSLPVE